MAARIVKDADERKEELLRTALELFAERGYENTPVQAITDAIGIAKGTFYHYFDSKEALLNDLVFYFAEHIFENARTRVAESDGDAIEKFRILAGDTARAKVEMLEVTMPMGRMLRQPENRMILERLVDEYGSQLTEVVRQIIEQGVDEGQFHVTRPDMTAEIVVAVLFGLSRSTSAASTELNDPAVAAVWFDIIEAFEEAVGRILGVESGGVSIYDIDSLRKQLAEHAEGGA